MTTDNKFKYSMFFLRASVFLVILMWTVDKFVNPGHTAAIFNKFYSISGLASSIFTIIGVLELILLALFFIGFKKTITYGAVLLLHAASTLSSFGQYLSPFEGNHLLFFAAWPMLAACVMLFLFRKEDTFLQIDQKFA
ncbi:hypothetical protein OO007_19420 [Cocleimonas sp. KMM 6892]|uniref:hypothetical protein n=1 Tax=unclassified Cocleimonas TaxID=2639732 RepID=UPI002DBC8501|nr:MULTISPECIES: hypothetical protein [unclassified Cocleimonas]MEB8434418.1 hypothetical protein [Cocleimonas sp. KMM 6892]MEC4717311.1 hypothetical protein [Cocleimonas sp. KMM 6895]MEC4746690.1 hypothetical protein [Cocleimonas sp. KMM 6896]